MASWLPPWGVSLLAVSPFMTATALCAIREVLRPRAAMKGTTSANVPCYGFYLAVLSDNPHCRSLGVQSNSRPVDYDHNDFQTRRKFNACGCALPAGQERKCRYSLRGLRRHSLPPHRPALFQFDGPAMAG